MLNLWQKNNVFKSEIIQPLLDMAAGIPPPVVTPVLPSTTAAMSNNTPGKQNQMEVILWIKTLLSVLVCCLLTCWNISLKWMLERSILQTPSRSGKPENMIINVGFIVCALSICLAYVGRWQENVFLAFHFVKIFSFEVGIYGKLAR